MFYETFRCSSRLRLFQLTYNLGKILRIREFGAVFKSHCCELSAVFFDRLLSASHCAANNLILLLMLTGNCDTAFCSGPCIAPSILCGVWPVMLLKWGYSGAPAPELLPQSCLFCVHHMYWMPFSWSPSEQKPQPVPCRSQCCLFAVLRLKLYLQTMYLKFSKQLLKLHEYWFCLPVM